MVVDAGEEKLCRGAPEDVEVERVAGLGEQLLTWIRISDLRECSDRRHTSHFTSAVN